MNGNSMRGLNPLAIISLLVLCFAGILQPVNNIRAQEFLPDPDEQGVFLDVDEDADRLMMLALRYSDTRKWRACFKKYQQCIREFGDKLTRSSVSPELFVSVKEAVRLAMAASPREARDIWELLQKGEFDARLLGLRAKGYPLAGLEKLEADFSGLSSGVKAMLLLAEACFARGELERALGAWKRVLLNHPEGDYPRIKLLARAGLLAAQGGMAEETGCFLDLIRKESALAEVSAGGVNLRILDAIEKALRLKSVPESGTGSVVTCGPFGGDSTCNRPAPGIEQQDVRLWNHKLPVARKWLTAQISSLSRYGISRVRKFDWPYPNFYPVAYGDYIIVAGEQGAIAFRSLDGGLAWTLAKSEPGLASCGGLSAPAISVGTFVARQGSVSMTNTRYPSRIVDKKALGLFLLDPATGKPLTVRRIAPVPDQLGLGGGAGNGPSSVLQFVSAPLEKAGRIFSGVIRTKGSAEYEVASFSRSGKLLWSRFISGSRAIRLASPRNWGGMKGALLTEIGQPLAASGGKLYVVNNLGAVACLDVVDGTINWIRTYRRYQPKEARAKVNYRYGYQTKVPDPRKVDLWEAGVPVLTGNLLLVVPQDCNYLLAIERDSGRLLWRAARMGMRRILGAAEGKVFLSGPSEIIARDLKSGKALWRSRFSSPVVGRGVMGKGYLAVSTEKALEVVNLAGKKLYRRKWENARTEAGNLLVHGGSLFSVSATHLNAYCNLAATIASRMKAIQKQPERALPHYRLACLYVSAGRFQKGLSTLQQSSKLLRQGEKFGNSLLSLSVRDKSWEAYWGLSLIAFKAGKTDEALLLLASAQKLADGDRLSRTLLTQARYLEKIGRHSQALACFRRIGSEFPNLSCAQGKDFKVAAWLKARGEISRLAKLVSAEVRAQAEQEALQALANAKAAGQHSRIWELALRFPETAAVANALADAALVAESDGKFSLAFKLMRRQVLLGGNGPDQRGSCAQLALMYQRQGYLKAAREVADVFMVRGGSFVSADGLKHPAADLIKVYPQLAKPELLKFVASPEVKWKVSGDKLYVPAGCQGDQQLVVVTSNKIRAVQVRTGKLLWSVSIPALKMGISSNYYRPGQQQVTVDGDAVIVKGKNALAVLERSTGKLRWKDLEWIKKDVRRTYSSNSNIPDVSSYGKPSYSHSDGIFVRWSKDTVSHLSGEVEELKLLNAHSIDSGKILWTLQAQTRKMINRNTRTHTFLRKSGRRSDGRIVAWNYTPNQYTAGRQVPHFATMIVTEAAPFRAPRVQRCPALMPLGLFGDRLICRDNSGRIAALKTKGGSGKRASKAWSLTQTNSVLMAASDKYLIVEKTGSTVRKSRQIKVLAVHPVNGKKLWEYSYKRASGIQSYNLGRTGLKLVHIYPGFLGMVQSKQGSKNRPVANGYQVRDLKNGKLKWETSFIPAYSAAVVTRDHIAFAFLQEEVFSKTGRRLLVKRDIYNNLTGRPGTVAKVRLKATVRFFRRDGGKAVFEGGESKESGSASLHYFQRIAVSSCRIFTVKDGLVLTTPKGLVMLGSPVPEPPAPDPKTSTAESDVPEAGP
jgi:outer membrane protein assembly factor BamB